MSINYAHRGASGYYPENTMLAFKKAVEMGCQGIETDVHITKDGVMVLCHDEKVDRTTNGTGLILDYTYEELCKFDAGIKFGEKFKGLKIPTLEEFLEFIRDNNIVVNLELKNNRIDYKDLEKRVIERVYYYNLEHKTIISSFNHYSIMKCKSIDSSIKVGFLYDDPIYRPGQYGKLAGVDAMHPNYLTLRNGAYEDIRENHLAINTYTVNDEEAMKKMIEWDIEGIITNYPDKLKALLDKKKA